jgi:hypothetical protein
VSRELLAGVVNPYESFLQGNLSFADFADAVAASYTFVLRETERVATRRAPEPPVAVVVGRDDLLPMLRRYLAGAASAEDLSLWAFTIVAVDAFDLSGLPEATADQLQSLSFAPIPTSVTHSAVEALLLGLHRGG